MINSTSKAKTYFLPSFMETKQVMSCNKWLFGWVASSAFWKQWRQCLHCLDLVSMCEEVFQGCSGSNPEEVPWLLIQITWEHKQRCTHLVGSWSIRDPRPSPLILLGKRSENQWSPHVHVEFTMKPLTGTCVCQSYSFKIYVDAAATVAAETSSILPQTSPSWH